jgi:7-cyano-7-deazaguanine synthase
MKNDKDIAVVAVSGGMDSCVTLAIANESFTPAMLHLEYGQRTAQKELECFEKIAAFYNVKLRLSTSLPHLKEIKGSSLIDTSIDIEKGAPDKMRIPSTYVPFRNAAILSVAVAWSEVIGAAKIFIGAVEEDGSGYPDCRLSFFEAFEKAARLGTKPGNRITIEAPIIHMKKSEIVETGIRLKAPFHLTWSCYVESEIACGECESCYLRQKGFHEAGIEDPIPYKRRAVFNE